MANNYHVHTISENPTTVHDANHHGNHEHISLHKNFANLNKKSLSAFKIIMCITLLFAIVELVGGYWANSLALMSDAIHMVSDSFSILLAMFMAKISIKPASNKYSYGHSRADILGGLFNALFMIIIVGFIFYEALSRLLNPEVVNGKMVISIAIIGGLINLMGIFLLRGNSESLNTKGALLHIFADLMGSIGAIIAGITIYFTDWYILDPLLSILICCLLLFTAIVLIKRSLHVLMEGVPANIDYNQVGDCLSNIKNIISVHDLHIWMINGYTIALSAHVVINKLSQWPDVLKEIQLLLDTKFNIIHVTIQPEIKEFNYILDKNKHICLNIKEKPEICVLTQWE